MTTTTDTQTDLPFASLTDVLGRSWPILRTYPDGSFDCPFCAAAIITPKTTCENPWCLANPIMSVTCAQELDAKRERALQEAAERKRNHELAMARIEQERQERLERSQALYQEARAKGACLRCLDVLSHRPKF